MGAIAASGKPGALQLFRDLMLASASIPIIFPPVQIPVDADGRKFDEIHVDGGTVAQVFFLPTRIDITEIDRDFSVNRAHHLYVIRNSKIFPEWKYVEPLLGPIAGRSSSMLIRTQGLGDLIRIQAVAQHFGIDFNLAYIDQDFNALSKEMFDKTYMRKLYDYGYTQAKDGSAWMKGVPFFSEKAPTLAEDR